MKEVKYDTNKWKAIHFHGLEELISLVSYYLKESIDLMQFLSKYTTAIFFTQLEHITPSFYRKTKYPQ